MEEAVDEAAEAAACANSFEAAEAAACANSFQVLILRSSEDVYEEVEGV